jgi:acyl-CoA reductase-like NAD-dependent aldehyde dehydrogenase
VREVRWGGLQNKQQLAKVLSMEMGKPMKQALGEISATQSRVRFLVDNASKVLEPVTVSRTATFEERVEYEPLGVVANISAWNYPYFVARSVLSLSLPRGPSVRLRCWRHAAESPVLDAYHRR